MSPVLWSMVSKRRPSILSQSLSLLRSTLSSCQMGMSSSYLAASPLTVSPKTTPGCLVAVSLPWRLARTHHLMSNSSRQPQTAAPSHGHLPLSLAPTGFKELSYDGLKASFARVRSPTWLITRALPQTPMKSALIPYFLGSCTRLLLRLLSVWRPPWR